MSVGAQFAVTGAVLAVAVLVLWLVSLAKRDASIVDIFWGPGFALIAWASLLASGSDSGRSALLVGLVTLWALRLGGYLLWRAWGSGEDPRYVAMRRYWGERFPWVSLATVFALQGVLMWLVSLPVQLAIAQPGPELWTATDVLGVALFALGLGFESVGDWQLARYRASGGAQGTGVLDTGLWRYTRHPNYFGDAVVWWGLFAVAASTPWGRWAFLAPALMTFLLLRVSGVAMLERSIDRRRPGYREYVARTSAFLPWPPRPAA